MTLTFINRINWGVRLYCFSFILHITNVITNVWNWSHKSQMKSRFLLSTLACIFLSIIKRKLPEFTLLIWSSIVKHQYFSNCYVRPQIILPRKNTINFDKLIVLILSRTQRAPVFRKQPQLLILLFAFKVFSN